MIINVPKNTGGITDGDKGDVTVSGSGSIFTIDNLAVNNPKINDVDATKVNQDSSRRFVSDIEKTTWNNKHDSPSGTPDGSKYLRDDNTWQSITGGSGLAQYQIRQLIRR